MYTTEKKKVVREMVVFLDRQYIVFAADLMGGKEYDYWEHIEVLGIFFVVFTTMCVVLYYFFFLFSFPHHLGAMYLHFLVSILSHSN